MKYINSDKLNKLNITKDNVFIVLDFDRTITDFDSQDSWAACGGLLEDDFQKDMDSYYNYYVPIETNYEIDIKEKEKYMIEWYDKCMGLYYKYHLTKTMLEQSIKEGKIKFRKGAKEFLNAAKENNIPIIILSAGIGNVIEIFLKINNCYFDNMCIISNFIKFDENNNMKKFNENMIHTMNKTMKNHLPKKFEDKINEKQHGILVGDLISDINMVEANRLENIVTIGFLNNENNLDVYNKNFDIVLQKEDADFENINNIIFK